jgi:hypothetical protein
VSRYYYYIPSIPSLAFGASPPFPSARFLKDLPYYLDRKDAPIVASARLEHPSEEAKRAAAPSPVLAQWYRWDLALRNELTRLRGQETGRDSQPWLREGFPYPDAVAAARAAFAAPSPLEGEMILERARWDALERLKALHYFDRDFLVVYSLELQLLERLACFRKEAGAEEYGKAYDAVMAAAGPKSDTGVTS